jgi:pimeloyl-ACP methyl ester carboxylesterase
MVTGPESLLYNDVPEDLKRASAGELKLASTSTMETPLTSAAYLTLPTTYLFGENDAALPLAFQKHMVQVIEETTGITVTKETCDAGHCPNLSQPETLLKLTDKIVQA